MSPVWRKNFLRPKGARDPQFEKFQESLPETLKGEAKAIYKEYLKQQSELAPYELEKDGNMGYKTGMLLAHGLRSLRLSTVVLVVAAICVALLLLFPPFYVHLSDGMLSNKGHAFVLNPPNHGVLVARVDTSVLAADIFGVVVIAALVFFITWRNERVKR